jgi:hypothetical protein
MASTARVNQETREALLRARKAEIEEDPEKLEKILKETEQEQLGWELFYHGRMSLAEVIAELEPHLQPQIWMWQLRYSGMHSQDFHTPPGA